MKCKDKRVYLTEKDAEKRCKQLWKNAYKRFYYYKCGVCGNYHLTKTSPLTNHINRVVSGKRRY